MAPQAVRLKFTRKVVAAKWSPSSGFVGTLKGRPIGRFKKAVKVFLEVFLSAALVVLVLPLLPSVLVNVLNGFRLQPLLQSWSILQNGLKLSTS